MCSSGGGSSIFRIAVDVDAADPLAYEVMSNFRPIAVASQLSVPREDEFGRERDGLDNYAAH
jgi:hypothetical protein